MQDDLSNGDEFPSLGLVSIWFGVVLIGITAVLRILAQNRTPLQTNPLLEGLHFALIALILASLLYLGLRTNRRFNRAAVPLIINLGTLLIVRFVPFDGLWQDLHFRWQFSRYNQVVELVQTGAIQPDEQGAARLPWQYRSLSANGGDVLINQTDGVTRVFFFTRPPAGRSFSGYLFHGDDTPPQSGEFNGRWRVVSQVRPSWFYCESFE